MGAAAMRGTLLSLLLLLAAPALASVADGARKWREGDWAAAVAEWRAPGAAGGPGAPVKMGQGARRGGGGPASPEVARAD